MIKRNQGIITFLMLIFLLNITQVVADKGYVLIVYYEFGGDTPTPGDTLTVKAELYKEGNRITDSVEVEITHIDGIDNLNTPISMADDGGGIFSYELTIPLTVDNNYIDLTFSVYINNKKVDSESLSIIMSDDELEEKAPSRPINSISHGVAAPGETVEVLTYIPDIEYGNINSSEASVTVVFRIPSSSLESTEKKSTYIGDGFFSAEYTIPLDVVIEDTLLYITPYLSVVIRSEYSGENFYDHLSIYIGGLTVITKTAFTNNELTIDVLVLAFDYTPVEGVTINARINLLKEPYQSEIINLTLPNTDAYGRSTKTVEITRPDITSITGLINATKGNLYAFGSFNVFLYEDSWYDSFIMVPGADYLKEYFENYEKGVSLDMYAYLEGKKLANAKIDVYASWREGIIDIFTIETDNDGRLSIDIDWPTNFGALSVDIMDITFVYINGTEWFEYEYPMTKSSYDLEFNSGPKPIVNYNDYNDYQVVKVSYQLSTSVKMGSIYMMPFYKEYLIFYTLASATGGPFYDLSSIIGVSFIKPTNGIISSLNIIDKAFTLEYMMIFIQYPDSSAITGLKYVIWVLDPNGVPIDGSQSGIIIGFGIFSGALLFSSMITLVIFKRRKRLDY